MHGHRGTLIAKARTLFEELRGARQRIGDRSQRRAIETQVQLAAAGIGGRRR